MNKLFVTFRFQPHTVGNLRRLIEFLEKGEQQLKQDEDTEIVIVCDVIQAKFTIGMAKLKPSEEYDRYKPYEVIPSDHMILGGVSDTVDENNVWKRLYPPPPQKPNSE